MVEEGDSTGSVQHWRRALEIYPGHTGFLTDYARFLLANGNPQEADELVSQALQLRPDAPDGLFVQGLVDKALGRESRARERAATLAELGFSEMAGQLIDSLAVPRPSTR
jgi:tetratricopeptide (TPR) repeat protein